MKFIIGVDEVGRGPLAGPVVAAAVALPYDFEDPRIKDSKKLSARNREAISPIIRSTALAWSVVAVGHRRIDERNIRNASLLAMRLALDRVLARVPASSEISVVLVDGNAEIPLDALSTPKGQLYPPQKTVVKGDSLHVQIAAASILAKVWRDNQMQVLHTRYPGYGFDRHAGYPTEQHRKAIAAIGPSPVHRSSFSGVREFVRDNSERQGSKPPLAA
jgi:ribonuclease HII